MAVSHRQESRQLLGDKKIYADCELCLTGKNCSYKRESVWQERKNHIEQNKWMTFILSNSVLRETEKCRYLIIDGSMTFRLKDISSNGQFI